MLMKLMVFNNVKQADSRQGLETKPKTTANGHPDVPGESEGELMLYQEDILNMENTEGRLKEIQTFLRTYGPGLHEERADIYEMCREAILDRIISSVVLVFTFFQEENGPMIWEVD